MRAWLSGPLTGIVVASFACTSEGPAPTPAPTPTPEPTAAAGASAVDLLLAIDDSPGMADKQKVLAQTLPQLLRGLARPRCVDDQGATIPGEFAAASGTCARGTPAFAPVKDIHVGVVTSSLGSPGATIDCDRNGTNTHAHLLNDARVDGIPREPAGFLGYNAAGAGDLVAPYTDVDDFAAAAASYVTRAGEAGCGFEAQLESVYRFLSDPEPPAGVVLDQTRADLVGIDATLLAQRAAFLRPESTVVVVVLTDEDDSGVDPRSLAGRGWLYQAPEGEFPFRGATQRRTDPRYGVGPTAPGATGVCATDLTSPRCLPCWASPDQQTDPACQRTLDPQDDPFALRMWAMKRRFGYDPQFPIRRYVDGLSLSLAPRRADDHDGSGVYTGGGRCTNPLFAELSGECAAMVSARDPSQVFLAILGGLPEDLLHEGGDVLAPRKQVLTPADWAALGTRGTATDPRMIPAAEPRPGTTPATDWDSGRADLMFACTFPLPAPRVAVPGAGPTGTENLAFPCSDAWDAPLCDRTRAEAAAAGLPRSQVRAGAYPATRLLRVAEGLGDRAVVGSICPTNLRDPAAPDFAYRGTADALLAKVGTTLRGAR